jgi:hypothetical protein
MYTLTVRWLDGSKKEYVDILYWQASSAHLWFEWENSESRWIPLNNIRWFAIREEENEEDLKKNKEPTHATPNKKPEEPELTECPS